MICVHDHLINHSRVHDTNCMNFMFINGPIHSESFLIEKSNRKLLNSSWNFYIREINSTKHLFKLILEWYQIYMHKTAWLNIVLLAFFVLRWDYYASSIFLNSHDTCEGNCKKTLHVEFSLFAEKCHLVSGLLNFYIFEFNPKWGRE